MLYSVYTFQNNTVCYKEAICFVDRSPTDDHGNNYFLEHVFPNSGNKQRLLPMEEAVCHEIPIVVNTTRSEF